MKLPIYLYGHPVLRKISEPIEAADDELRTLVSNMFETSVPSSSSAASIGSEILRSTGCP